MFVGIIVLLAVAVLVFSLVSASNRRQRVQPMWEVGARQLGIAPPPAKSGFSSKLSMSGVVDDWSVSIRERSDDDSTWIDFELGSMRGLPFGLSVRAEHAGSRLPVVGLLFSGGQRQVTTGDARFDDDFIVIGDDPGEAGAFLTPDRRASLQRLAVVCPKFRLGDGSLTWRFNGKTEKLGDIARPMQAMLETARALTGAARSTAIRPEDMAPPEPGQAFPARSPSPSPPPSGPPPGTPTIEEDSPTGEAAGVPAPPGQVFPSAPGRQPMPPPGGPDVDQQALLQSVFAARSSAADSVFDETLRGRRVRWSGTLVRCRRFANDLDLGAGPGMRAVVDLGQVATAADAPAGVAATVTATVALPLDVAVDVGAEVVFEGSVATFDHFARTLVVLDARLAGPPG